MSAFLGHVQSVSERYIEVFGEAGALFVAALVVFMASCAVWCIALAVEGLMSWRKRRRTERQDRVIAAATGRRSPPAASGLTSSRKRCG